MAGQVLKPKTVLKGWGHECCIVNNDAYAGKLLVFGASKKSSMHFHLLKHETFYVLKGQFVLGTIDRKTAAEVVEYLHAGDTREIPPGTLHQLVCIQEGTIIEFSTHDDPEDSIRVAPGDSQTKA